MSAEIKIDKTRKDEDIYNLLMPQLDSLIAGSEPVISGLMNFTSALKDSFDKISWVGFYIRFENRLYLGPFQGKPACTVINIGEGVCGKSAADKTTIIVEDVNSFPGHIACDAGSRSEIVVPVLIDGSVWGVLDVDSYEYAAFSEPDKIYLNKYVEMLKNKLDLLKFSILNNAELK